MNNVISKKRPVRRWLAFAAVTVLASCGIDGAPIPPSDNDLPEPGITLSGTAEVGVVGGSGSYTREVSR